MLKSVKYLDPNDMIHSAKDDVEPADSGETSGLAPEGSGHKIHMRLLQRPQMTTLALPSSSTWPSEAVPPHSAPFDFIPDALAYSRYVLATPDYMSAELARELGELSREYDLLKGDDLGREFVAAARIKVERQMEKVKTELMTPLVEREADKVREAWAEVDERQQKAAMRTVLAASAPAFTPSSETLLPEQDGYIIPPNRPVEPNAMPSSSKRRRKPQTPAAPSAGPSYHFYQSSLGANVFLHPLDIRILLSHYESYSLFPSLISFTSPGFDPDTITDDLRKRAKYLSHLPLGTEVVFVEADLEPLVGAASLVPFDQALKARRQKRRTRVQKEDKAKVKAEKAERERHNHVSAEERDYMSAISRSAIGNTMHGGEGIASDTSAGSLGTSPTWTSRSFAGALHSTARPYKAAAKLTREPREGTGEDVDPELDAQMAWDAAFENLDLEDARGGIRETSRGGGRSRAPEADGPVLGSEGKKGKKAKKVLVLGGGGRRA
jgi:hypothetical protein